MAAWSRPSRLPRDRTVDRHVDLEHARAVAIALQAAAKAIRQAITGDRRERPRRHVEERNAVRREVVHPLDGPTGLDPSAARDELGGERLGEPARAAFRERPAVDVGRAEHDQRSRATDRLGQRQDRVRAGPGDEGTGPVVPEPAREARRRLDGRPTEARQAHGSWRPQRHVERREDVALQLGPGANQRLEGSPVRVGVGTEPCRGRFEVALDQDRRPVVERVAHAVRRFHPAQAVPGEVQLGEERRGPAEGVDGAAHVVDEARQRALGRADAAAHGLRPFEERDRMTGPRELDRGRQAVGPAAHDHGIGSVHPPSRRRTGPT